MSEEETKVISIKLSPKMDAFLRKKVREGLYNSRQDYIRFLIIEKIREEKKL